jgi:hypothetical protein
LFFDVEVTSDTVTSIRAASAHTFVYLGRDKSQELIFSDVTRKPEESAILTLAIPLGSTTIVTSGDSAIAGTGAPVHPEHPADESITDTEFVQLVMSVVYDSCGTTYHFASLKDHDCGEATSRKGAAFIVFFPISHYDELRLLYAVVALRSHGRTLTCSFGANKAPTPVSSVITSSTRCGNNVLCKEKTYVSYFKSVSRAGLYQMTFHIPSDCCRPHQLHSSAPLMTAARLRSNFVDTNVFNQATALVCMRVL